jgi:arylsulfatase A-like enzyme
MFQRLATLLAVLLLAWASSASTRAADAPSSKPNVLFIAVDDLNHWVGYMGRNAQTRTPNIDRLAARGIRFTHAYAPAPVCNPSRAALMSGLLPSASGVYNNSDDWRQVISEDLTLTTTFRKGGYWVGGAGKIYHEAYRRRSEWDDYLAREGGQPQPKGNDRGVGGIKFAPLDCRDEDLPDYRITDWAIDQLGRKHDKPFFLACGLHKPHMPWFVPRKYYDQFPLDKIALPPVLERDLDDVPRVGIEMADPQGDHANILKSGRWKEAVQGYLAAIAYADMNVGRLIDALDKSAYRDNTIVVFWGDHGWHLGEKLHWRKFTLWEEATRAPMVWVVPGVTRPGGVCERTVDFMSIYPTLTDLCGIPTPKHVEGVSIRPLLADPGAPWDKPARTTYQFSNHAVRTADWRYIRYHDGGEELYDERQDPLEWTNLASKPELAPVKAELAKAMPTKNTPEMKRAAPASAPANPTSPAERRRQRQAARREAE